MDASTVYTLVLKLASSGGTVYALAAFGACALLTAVIGQKIYSETKRDNEIKQAWKDFNDALTSGNASALRDAIQRLSVLQKK